MKLSKMFLTKKFFTLLALLFFSIAAFSQTATIDLTPHQPTTTPSVNSVFEWHSTDVGLADANKLTGTAITAATTNTYYGVFYDATSSCYSPAAKVDVKISACGATGEDLSTYQTGIIHTGTLQWYTDIAATLTLVTNPLITTNGTYFLYDNNVGVLKRLNEVVIVLFNPLPTAVLASSDADDIFCAGTSVTFTATGGTNYNFRVAGISVQNSVTATYTTTALTMSQAVDVIVTDASGCSATSTEITNTVNPNLPASVSISGSLNNICSGTSVTFTATATNGGLTPTYKWYNGANLISGETASTYTSTALANNDAITVQMTSNATCAIGSPATSNQVTMIVNPNLPASVSISGSLNNICSGTSVTFTATATNGGLTPTYKWYNGANLISGETASTYTSTALANNDAITVQMTSNATCATGSPATSNQVTMIVNPLPSPPTVLAPTINNDCASSTPTTVNLISMVTNATGDTIEWYTNANHTGIPYATPTTAGTSANLGTAYYVFYKNPNGCYSTGTQVNAITAGTCCPAGYIAPVLN